MLFWIEPILTFAWNPIKKLALAQLKTVCFCKKKNLYKLFGVIISKIFSNENFFIQIIFLKKVKTFESGQKVVLSFTSRWSFLANGRPVISDHSCQNRDLARTEIKVRPRSIERLTINKVYLIKDLIYLRSV